MIDPGHGRLGIARQCSLVSISRSSFYYQGKGESPLNLNLMPMGPDPFSLRGNTGVTADPDFEP